MPPRRVVTGRSQEPRQRFAEELRLLRAQSGETLGGPEVVQALDQHYGTPGLLLTLWELALVPDTPVRRSRRAALRARS